jgi:hypothetical protein
MAQRGRKTTLEERVEMGERWEAGETDPEIAAAMNRSVWTVPCTGRTGQCASGDGGTNERGKRVCFP